MVRNPRCLTAFTVATALLLLTPGFAAAQDDAGSGGDAPDAWQDAVHVAAGTLRGSLDSPGGDLADWYRARSDGPHAIAFSLTFDTASPHWKLRLMSDGGTLIREQAVSKNATSTVYLGSADPVRIGVASNATDGSGVPSGYSLTFRFQDVPDVAVEDLAVGPHALFTSEISFNLVNHGRGDARDASAIVTVRYEGGRNVCEELILVAGFDLGSGNTARTAVAWDKLGGIGDARVKVRAYVPDDTDLGNNGASAPVFVGVGGLGFGTNLDCLLYS